MWRDLGLGDWYFEVDSASGSQIAQRLLEIHAKYGESQRKVRGAVTLARRLQDEAMGKVHKIISSAAKA